MKDFLLVDPKGSKGAKNAPWDLLDISDDPNDMVYTWENLFLEVLDRHTPLRKRQVKNKLSPWLTSHIKKLMYKSMNKCTIPMYK